jgi:hypothetical protein
MSDETYNGWAGKGTRASAYATWRVALELCDPDNIGDNWEGKPSHGELADYIWDMCTEYVTEEDHNAEHIATQYALAFLEDVDWHEIADNILSDWPEDDDESDE